MSFKIEFSTPNTTHKHQPQDADSSAGRDYLEQVKASSLKASNDLGIPPRQEQMLDYSKWLPYAAKTYQISPNIEDYVVVNTPMIPSDIPNRNGVGFPLHELIQFRPPPISNVMYRSWTRCPTFMEHASNDNTKALGVILDTTLVPIRNYGDGRHWMVMVLLAFDKTKYSDRVAQIAAGLVNTYSMGANCEYFSCGMTGIRIDPKNPMDKLRLENPLEFNIRANPQHNYQDYIMFRNAHNLVAGECSTVDDPAWAPALSDIVLDLDGAI